MKGLTVSPSAPKRLRRMMRKVRHETGTYNIRETARRLGVNQKYVSDALKGIEPTDQTENGMDVRVKLGYPRHRRKQYKKRTPQPAWLARTRRAIRVMVKETNEAMRSRG